MRVLVVVLLNLMLLLTLTIASVHLQQDQSANEDSWVHVALIIVCLAQFTMTAVWAAIARGWRLCLWPQGLVLAIACTVPFFIGLSGMHLSHSYRPLYLALLVIETHLAIAMGWSGLLLTTLVALRLIKRWRSPQLELAADTSPETRTQAVIGGVCTLVAMVIVIGYATGILPMIDHLPFFLDPVPDLWWWNKWLNSFLEPFAFFLGLLACSAVVSLLFIEFKKRGTPSPATLHALPVVKHLRNPGVAILCTVSMFFIGLQAAGSIDQFKLRVLGRVKRSPDGQVLLIGKEEPVSWFANDRTLACLEKHTAVKGLGLFGLSISDSGLTHLRGLKDLEGLVIAPFGKYGEYLDEDYWRGGVWIEGGLGLNNSSPITDEGLRNFQDLKHLKGLDLSGLDISDKGLVFFSGNTKLERMHLSHTRVAGTAFQSLDLPCLRELDLYFCDQLTDAGLMHLKGLTALETLNLYGTKITGTGFSHLKGLANLQSLWAGKTKFTDMGLVHLAGFTNLQQLSLAGTPITDVGLVHLRGMTNLQTLHLWDTKVTDTGLAQLKGLTKLQELSLESLAITDAGLVHLKGLIGLQELKLAGTQITDAGLKHLTGLKNLREFPLVDTEVTDVGVAELKKALPDCNIIWWPSSRGLTWSPSSRRATE
jgi:internalin A